MSSTSSTTKKNATASNKRGGSSNPKRKSNNNNKKSTKVKQSTPDPPLECTQEDFDALLQDASELADFDEASSELIDCARYGEVDACRAILDVWSSKQQPTQAIVNAIDNSQSTPLHKASANGHLSTVQLLLSRGAEHLQNDSGNTPLHWAAASGHAEVVNMLLSHYDAAAKNNKKNKPQPLDVLLKNNFGRSALTEGFQSGDTKTVEHLLNHDSAEEERLIGGLDGKAVEDDEMGMGGSEGGEVTKDSGDGGKKSIVHEFDFLRDCGVADGPCVSIRELVSA
jgi:ankyrin repeat protein